MAYLLEDADPNTLLKEVVCGLVLTAVSYLRFFERKPSWQAHKNFLLLSIVEQFHSHKLSVADRLTPFVKIPGQKGGPKRAPNPSKSFEHQGHLTAKRVCTIFRDPSSDSSARVKAEPDICLVDKCSGSTRLQQPGHDMGVLQRWSTILSGLLCVVQ
jgi:hypothetical protein